jgi:predicted ATPase with chaperone activity
MTIGTCNNSGEAEGDAGVVTIICSCSAPPGAGKSMLAWRLTTILPAMILAEAIETMRIHRITGLTGDRTAWVTTRPFRAPITRSRLWA